jgi:hypothetical protein
VWSFRLQGTKCLAKYLLNFELPVAEGIACIYNIKNCYLFKNYFVKYELNFYESIRKNASAEKFYKG